MTKRALLIGCNYASIPSATLQGCINDVVNVRNTLIDAYGYNDANIVMLRDDDKSRLPTKAIILSSMISLISASTAEDTLWIHYSGHGTQIRNTTGDETDGLDECIVPLDFAKAGVIDDNTLFKIIGAAKCQLILCFDSCHSGTVCDLQYSTNYVNGSLVKSSNNSKQISNPNIIMLSGCRDAQTSADAYSAFSRQGVGAFTLTLLETLRGSGHNIDIIQLYQLTCLNLQRSGFPQIPILSSSSPLPNYKFARHSNNVFAVISQPERTSQPVGKKEVAKQPFRGPDNVFNSVFAYRLNGVTDSQLFPSYKTGNAPTLNMNRLLQNK